MMKTRTSLALLGAAGFIVASCYNPHIDDGALRCSAASECPSGFDCHASDGHCYRSGGGATGGSGGGEMCTVAQGAYGPFPGCTPEIDQTCDPVCQAGCPCGERCKAEKGGLVCQNESPPFQGLADPCDASDDSCRPGLVCLIEDADEPRHAACGAHCYQHCRVDGDCQKVSPISKCGIGVTFPGSNLKLQACTQGPESCKPWGDALCAKTAERPAGTFACYVLTSAPDQTICECAGLVPAGQPCMFEHDCVAGYDCVEGALQDRRCRRMCAMGGNAEARCPLPQTCSSFAGSTKYGYCRP